MHKGYAFVQFTNPFDARNACLGEDGRNILSQTLGKLYRTTRCGKVEEDGLSWGSLLVGCYCLQWWGNNIMHNTILILFCLGDFLQSSATVYKVDFTDCRHNILDIECRKRELWLTVVVEAQFQKEVALTE